MTTAFDIATLNATVNLANTATNASEIVGGTAGSLLYQSAPNVTNYIGIGATGYVLQSNGSSATWVSTSTLGIGGGGGGSGAISVYNQGILISATTTSLNFVGASVTATSVGSTGTVSITITDAFARTIALLSA